MNMKPIKLENKLTVKGEEFTSVQLVFSKLTGRDLIKAEAEVRADGEVTPMLTFSMKYQAALAARMIGITYDDMMDMNANDFSKITNAVLNFLTKQG
ncbi:phage tail assembly protein [uncultured Megasphaera sp.]|uniref:phage tail assembly protein n=1 Tax=uncultured Megasphaera sp. TaxID=165188 RepID=UPI00266C2C89|nr:phage tail assembly protein [uncultured Megasphaera sp.]